MKCSYCNNEVCPKGCLYAPQRFKGRYDTTPEMHQHLVEGHGFNWDHQRQAHTVSWSAEKFHEGLHRENATKPPDHSHEKVKQ